MNVRFTADVLMTPTDDGTRFTRLTRDGWLWFEDNDLVHFHQEGPTIVITNRAEAAEVFMQMAEDGLRVATPHGLSVDARPRLDVYA